MPNESTRTVLVAIAADAGVALAQVGAAVFTGSPAVAATASESLADTANDLFLLLAQRRSARPPDAHHALGYGREAYFWALPAGFGVFIGGAVFSLREGIDELIHPGVTSSFAVAYVVLAISVSFSLVSFRRSAGQMSRRARRFHRNLLAESRVTSDPTLRTVFLADIVAFTAGLLTLAALVLNQITGSSISQGVAAILIGLAQIGIGLRLLRRSHDFLVGAWITAAGEPENRLDIAGFTYPFRPAWEEKAKAFLHEYPGVEGIREILTTFVGPSQVWIVARVDVDDDLTGAEVESLVRGIESGMKQLEFGEPSNTPPAYIYRVDVVPVG